MNEWAKGEGQPGLGYIFWREGEEGGAGPVAKNLGPERTGALREQFGLGVGDAVFFVAGKPRDFVKFAGPARNKIGAELGLVAKDRFEFCWIVDFPMYEWNEEEKKIDFSTIRSRCRTYLRTNSWPSIPPIRMPLLLSRRSNTTLFATASSCHRARSGIIDPM